jgi:tetratricopeptide (TPR) repeat protein
MTALLDVYEQHFGQDATSITQRQVMAYKAGDLAKVSELTTVLTEKYPDRQQYFIMASDLQAEQGNDSLAFVYLQQAKRIDSTTVEYQMALADYYRRSERIAEYLAVLQNVFDNTQVTEQTKVKVLTFLHQFPQLISIFSDEVDALYRNVSKDSSIQNYELTWLYSQFLLLTRQHSKAETTMLAALQRAATVAPDKGDETMALYKTGFVLFGMLIEKQQWDSVIAYVDKYTSGFEKRHHFYSYKALALIQKNDYVAAKAVAELSLGQVEKTDTIALTDAYALLGDISFKLKDYSASDKYYTKALKYMPGNVLLLNNYAYYLSLRGKNLSKALKMSKLAIDRAPENATYLDTYAWILYKQERYDEAKSVFRRALMYNGDKESAILEHYGDVLFKLGEKDNALIYWKRAQDAGSENGEELGRKIEGVR